MTTLYRGADARRPAMRCATIRRTDVGHLFFLPRRHLCHSLEPRAHELFIGPVSLPLPLRNRLSELIIDSFHDAGARRGLETVTAVCADPTVLAGAIEVPARFPRDWFEQGEHGLQLKGAWKEHAGELCERARRAWQALCARPLDRANAPLAIGLDAAALLFDAGLYFEVHELLEPYWMRERGEERDALQGLIQIAVGFQHLANGNIVGARALLGDGCGRIRGRRFDARELDEFAHATERCRAQLGEAGETPRAPFDWRTVPRFPTSEGSR
jgi:DUF309 family protein family protein